MITVSPFKNDRLLKAIWRKPLDRTPIWIMRQAGRYLPEYRKLREHAGSFITLCKTPALACEATLQPLMRYALDAAIIFSDILTIPDAMGLGLQFTEGKGPSFARPIRSAKDIAHLQKPTTADLSYVYESIRLVQRELDQKVPLIGFCGSPWTLAAYMIEGQSNTGFPLAIKMLEEEPQMLHNLLDRLAQAVTVHLNSQIEAGVSVVMLFDTWGSLLKQHYPAFSLDYIQKVNAGLLRSYNNRKVPVILFTKNNHGWLEKIAQSGCDVVGVDFEISLAQVRRRIGKEVALQGNMNPSYLLDSTDVIRQAVKAVLSAFGYGSGHVFNLGHGITPDVPVDHVGVLVDAVHELSQVYHAS